MSPSQHSLIDKLFFSVFKVLLTIIGVILFRQANIDAIIRPFGEPGFIAFLALASICAYLYRERGRPRRSTSRSNLVFERQRLDPAEPAVPEDIEGEES